MTKETLAKKGVNLRGLLFLGIRKAKECSTIKGRSRIRKTNKHLREVIKNDSKSKG